MSDDTQATRTFYPSDYRHFAQAIQRARSVKGNRYQPKDADHQERIDSLVNAVAGYFAEDAAADPEGIQFSQAAFLKGTLMTQPPVYTVPQDGIDDEPEDDIFEVE